MIKEIILTVILSILTAQNAHTEAFKQKVQECMAEQKNYSKEDLELLAEVMYHENYCNGERCMLLTGSVVLNRKASPGYPDTIKDVLYQKGQYSTTKKFFKTKIPERVYELAEELLIGGSIAPENVVFQATFKQGKVYEIIKGEYFCYGN